MSVCGCPTHHWQPWLTGTEQKRPTRGLPWWLSGKESTCRFRRCSRHRFIPWVEKIPWKRIWQPSPTFLLGKSHGKRSLVGYSPGGHSESDMAEHQQSRAYQNLEGRCFLPMCPSKESLYRGHSMFCQLAKQPWDVMKQNRRAWIGSWGARDW